MLLMLNEATESVHRTFGFVVDSIDVDEQWIRNDIKIKREDLMFASSVEDIFKDIKSNLWVKELTVHKGFPNKISISVSRKEAVAAFQENSKFTLIDEEGEDIEHIDIKKLKNNIPIVIGNGARKEFWSLVKTISKHPTVQKKLNSMSYVRERRWDLVVSGGITVKLPEGDVSGSLESLELLMKQPKLNKNTVKVIDMRTKNKIIFSGSKLGRSGDKDKKTV
jgi:cell division protein FtsQ